MSGRSARERETAKKHEWDGDATSDGCRQAQRPTENRTHRRQETAEGAAEIPPRMPPATKPIASEGERPVGVAVA